PAPAAVTASVKLAAAAKGAAAGASIATVVHGGLKFMAWTKAKTALAVSLAVALTGTTVLLMNGFSRRADMAALQGTWIGQEPAAGAGVATVVVNGANLEFRSEDGGEW